MQFWRSFPANAFRKSRKLANLQIPALQKGLFSGSVWQRLVGQGKGQPHFVLKRIIRRKREGRPNQERPVPVYSLWGDLLCWSDLHSGKAVKTRIGTREADANGPCPRSLVSHDDPGRILWVI